MVGFYGISTIIGYLMPNSFIQYDLWTQFVDNIYKRIRAHLFVILCAIVYIYQILILKIEKPSKFVLQKRLKSRPILAVRSVPVW